GGRRLGSKGRYGVALGGGTAGGGAGARVLDGGGGVGCGRIAGRTFAGVSSSRASGGSGGGLRGGRGRSFWKRSGTIRCPTSVARFRSMSSASAMRASSR